MSVAPAPGARVTGSGALPGGRWLTWTAADGSRGRRWRAATTGADGRLVSGLLIETGPDGSLVRVELTAAAGLLALHPEADGRRLSGNCARQAGIDHVSLPWSAGCVLMFDTSPVTAAVAARALASRGGVGEGLSVPAIEVSETLAVRRATWRVARVAERRWHLLAADGGPRVALELDADGLPLLGGGVTWPMEHHSTG